MRFILAAGLALLFSLGALAQTVEVRFSETFQEDLDTLYGEREGDYLAREIAQDIQRSLKRGSLKVHKVNVTIERAVPNRPTMKQLERNPNLSLVQSFGVGGMELTAQAYDKSDAPIGEAMTYSWFERDIRNVVGFATWTDAHRASNRFSRRFSKSIRTELMRQQETR
ncbi:MAG: hypothetical protein AAFX02_04045 [Pseudomonadota bacterium]